MSLVEVLKGDRAERSLSEKTLKWELSSLNLASFSARLDSEDGLGDNRLSICSFLVIGAEMLVRFELMASDSGSGSSPSSNSDVSTSTFSLLHRVTLWRMNLIMSCRGKFVWHTPHTRRSFSCSTENKKEIINKTLQFKAWNITNIKRKNPPSQIPPPTHKKTGTPPPHTSSPKIERNHKRITKKTYPTQHEVYIIII